jgi:Transposase
MFVGIDWASTEHAVCVLDQTGKTVRAFRIPHSAAGFDDLVARLRRLGTPAGLPVALERPDGRLVDRLLEAGHPVVPVRSNAIKAWREGEVVSGAKSDAGDAKVIAEQPAAAPPPAADADAVLGRHPGAAGGGAGPG